MSKIKKEQCPSCGGSLIDDSEKQMYRCTSCGSSYDYDYFREEQLHEMGETYLSRGECSAAIDAYKLILEKKPHDFLALRGLMLAAAFLKDMDGLSRISEARHFSYDSKLADEVIEGASEEDKEYFTEFGKIYVNKQELIDRNREIKSLRRERESKEAYIRLVDNSRYEYYFETKHGELDPVLVFIAIWCLVALWCGPCLRGVFSNIDDAEVAAIFAVSGGLPLLIGACINFFYIYPKMRMIKKIDAAIRDLVTELEAADKKISTLEAEAEKFSDDIRKAISDFVKKDRLITKDSVEEQVPEFGKIKKHQCPSCGGSLRIDSDKQMYHCTFCGSTYDYEYFREERIHEAGETYLSRGEFMATTEAYEFMLKKDPHDFLALRGLMLAAAHLTDMSELDQVNESFSYDSQMVNRVIENASEDDKKYFTEFAKVYAAKKRLVDCSEEIEALREEKKKINSVIKEYNKGGEGKWPGDEFRTKGDMTIQYIIFWFLTAFFVMVALAFVYVIPILPFAIIFGITGLILVVLNNFIYFSSLRKMKELDKGNTELYGEFAKMEDKIRELENESSKLAGDIRRFVHEFVRKDRLKMRDYKSR